MSIASAGDVEEEFFSYGLHVVVEGVDADRLRRALDRYDFIHRRVREMVMHGAAGR